MKKISCVRSVATLLVALGLGACNGNSDYVTMIGSVNPGSGPGSDAGLLPAADAPATCGDGFIDVDEACDDGNTRSSDGCSSTCEPELCGNGRVDPGEACEPPGSETCDASCRAISNVVACGDARLSPGEECEDGNTLSEDGCSNLCRIERCGNQRIDPGELCEPPGTAICDSQCQLAAMPPVGCGNATLEGTEECDDGDLTSGDGCSDHCLREACGNLRLDVGAGETCDPTEAGYCDASCHLIPRVCGDGTRSGNEQCDDTNTNANDGCSPTCQIEFCGDGNVNQALGTEQCEPRNTPLCDNNCRRIECGNGLVQGTEQCDDGNQGRGDGCNEQCLIEACGNGRIDPREDCETPGVGNCGTNCRAIRVQCGDGVQQVGEECDDNNMAFGDGCSPTCLSERCGNGRVETPHEECEPPGTATCNRFCRLPRCGDRSVDPLEECEDGNRTDRDGCSSDCRVEGCGNGIVDVGEHCEPPTAGCGSDCSWLPEQGPVGPLGAAQFQISNTSFDAGLGGWQLSGTPPASILFSSTGSTPGAALLTTGPAETPAALVSAEVTSTQVIRASVSQCVRTSAQVSYRAVARVSRAEGNAVPPSVMVRARFFSTEACIGAATSVVSDTFELDTAGGWSELALEGLVAPAGTRALALSVELAQEQGQAPWSVLVDSLALARVSAPRCGDGIPEGNEECEPGVTPGCSSQCRRPPRTPVCGDGVLTAPEECDPPGPACLGNCTALQTLCGDGHREGAEQCDPPNGETCSATCQTIACGNARLEPPEQCDPPSTQSGCTAQCRLVASQPSTCGDGVLQGAEECDPPNPLGWCSGQCRRRNPALACGDNKVDGDLGEQCDPPNSVANNCGRTCQTAVCGDGKVEGAEQCDASSAGCTSCRFSFTGSQQQCHNCLAGTCRAVAAPASSDDLFSACFALQGVATGGPKQGTPLRQLCAEAVECIRQTGCAAERYANDAARAPSPAACYCGKSVLDPFGRDDAIRACLYGQHPADGPCKQVFEAAAQATSPGSVLAAMSAEGGQPALGAAVQLMSECGQDECKTNCAVQSACGNGIVEPGELCELTTGTTPNPFCAPGVCAILPCGNGTVDRTWPYGPGSELPGYDETEFPGGWKPETCDVADPFTKRDCGTNCQLTVTCGDGKLTASVEACDPGPTGDWRECCQPNNPAQLEGCDTNHNSKVDNEEGCRSPARCGNGVREGTEECDPPATGTCSADCKRIDACMTCTRESLCGELVNLCVGNAVIPSFREGCLDMLDCVERTRCDKTVYVPGVPPSFFGCLCGALDPATQSATCVAQGGTGPCWDVAMRHSRELCKVAPNVTDPNDQSQINQCVIGNLDEIYPVGLTSNIVSCRKDYECAQVCGYQQ